MMSLVSLAYVSVAIGEITQDDLMSILEIARKRNTELNITGMLLFRNSYFIQALEGEEQVVEELYNKIAKDPRHSHVHKVEIVPITERVFGDWSMGFHNLDGKDLSHIGGFTNFLDEPFNEENINQTRSHALATLEVFKTGTAY